MFTSCLIEVSVLLLDMKFTHRATHSANKAHSFN